MWLAYIEKLAEMLGTLPPNILPLIAEELIMLMNARGWHLRAFRREGMEILNLEACLTRKPPALDKRFIQKHFNTHRPWFESLGLRMQKRHIINIKPATEEASES